MYQEVMVPNASAPALSQLLSSPGLMSMMAQPWVRLGRVGSGLTFFGVGATGARLVRSHLPEIADIFSGESLRSSQAGNCTMAPCALSREYSFRSLLLDITSPQDQDAFMALPSLQQAAHLERIIVSGWRAQLEFLSVDTHQVYFREMFTRNFVESAPDLRVNGGFKLRRERDGLLVSHVHVLVNRRLSGPWFAGVGSASGHGLCEPAPEA